MTMILMAVSLVVGLFWILYMNPCSILRKVFLMAFSVSLKKSISFDSRV